MLEHYPVDSGLRQLFKTLDNFVHCSSKPVGGIVGNESGRTSRAEVAPDPIDLSREVSLTRADHGVVSDHRQTQCGRVTAMERALPVEGGPQSPTLRGHREVVVVFGAKSYCCLDSSRLARSPDDDWRRLLNRLW